uniref:Uncharacterized protein n=1 Tax=Molossus molossus TaxID=27622 RepID=A0A7J8DTD8_MOLMO|nr:hypothetical protein HJG59_009184 [Molossus molossus]
MQHPQHRAWDGYVLDKRPFTDLSRRVSGPEGGWWCSCPPWRAPRYNKSMANICCQSIHRRNISLLHNFCAQAVTSAQTRRISNSHGRSRHRHDRFCFTGEVNRRSCGGHRPGPGSTMPPDPEALQRRKLGPSALLPVARLSSLPGYVCVPPPSPEPGSALVLFLLSRPVFVFFSFPTVGAGLNDIAEPGLFMDPFA